jgi:hypothetical protein
MPERIVKTIRVDASKAQGEGAYIELRPYLWEERRALQLKIQGIPTDVAQFRLAMTPILEEELSAHLVDWNFVDGEGKPIDVGNLGQLVDEEIQFVFKEIQKLIWTTLGTDESTKN